MTNFQTAAQMTGRPYNIRVATIGDSRTFQNTDDDGTNYRLQTRGYMNWVRFQSGQRIDWDPVNDNFGVNGDTSTGVLARLPAALLQSTAALWIVLISTNDRAVTPITADASIANLIAIRDMIIAAGRMVMFVAEMPRGDSTFTSPRLSGAQLDYHFKVHRWLLDQTGYPGVVVADPWPLMALDSSATGDAILGETYDGLHPSTIGARHAAQSIVSVINTIYPPRFILPSSNTGLYSANNPDGWLNANPMMVRLGSGTPGIGTGNIADSWTADATALGSVTLAYAMVTSGGKNWQQITIGGTSAASGFPLINLMKIAPGAVNLSVGDNLEGVCEIEVDAGSSNINCLGLRINEADASPNNKSAMDMAYSSGVLTADAHAGVQRVTKRSIATTNIRAALVLNVPLSVTVSAVVRVRAFGLRKVVSPFAS